MTYDNIKSRKESRFTQSLEDKFFEKPQGGSRVLGLNFITKMSYEKSRTKIMQWPFLTIAILIVIELRSATVLLFPLKKFMVREDKL